MKSPEAVLVTHAWSDRNKGDAAILASTLALLRKVAPGASITLMSEFAPGDIRLQTELSETLSEVPDVTVIGSVLPILPVRRASSLEAPPARGGGWSRLVDALWHVVRSVLVLVAAPCLVRSGAEARAMSMVQRLLARCLGLGRAELTSLCAVSQADVVISKGGGFIFGQRSLRSTVRLYRVLFPLLLARRLRRPIVLLGQSIGPFASPVQRALVQRALRAAAWIGVREAISAKTVRSLVGSRATACVRLMPDVALCLPSAPIDHPDLVELRSLLESHPRPWVGLTVRRWGVGASASDRRPYDAYLDALAGLCRHVRERYGGTVFVWLQCTGPGSLEDDRLAGRDLLSRVDRSGDRQSDTPGHVVWIGKEYRAHVLKGAFAQMDAFVATRFHSALFAMSSGVPTIAIDYWGPKARGIMRQLLNEEDLVLSYTRMSPECLLNTFDELWARRSTIRSHLREIVPQLASAVTDATGEALASAAGLGADGRTSFGKGAGGLHVLLAALNSGYGGVERHLIDLSRELGERGHKVTLVAPPRSRLAATVRANTAITVVEMARSALSVFRLWHLYQRTRPDIIHLHGPRATVIGRTAARMLPRALRARLAVISTAHGWISVRLRLRWLYEWLWDRTSHWEDACVAVALAVRDLLIRRGYSGRIDVIPNGIDPSWTGGLVSRLSAYNTPLRLGYFGRLDGEKGLGVLLDALNRIRGGDWHLRVYGDGRDRDLLVARTRSEGLASRVEFLGAVPDTAVPTHMADCHVVVLPSLQEACPYVVLEALSLGVPVVASAVGGVPDLVRDGENGLLVPPGDADALAAALSRLLDDPGLADRLRQGACHARQQRTAEQMAEQLVALYMDVLAVRRGSATGLSSDPCSGPDAAGRP